MECQLYWNGLEFERKYKKRSFRQAKAVFEEMDCEPFIPKYVEELNIGGERKRSWKKITVNGDEGFIEIEYQGDVAQIYADGELVADQFYYGVAWRVPARLLFKKQCYLVVSEKKNDFYFEF